MSDHVCADGLGVVRILGPGRFFVELDVRIGKNEFPISKIARLLGHDSTVPGRHITTRKKERRRCIRNRQHRSTLNTEGHSERRRPAARTTGVLRRLYRSNKGYVGMSVTLTASSTFRSELCRGSRQPRNYDRSRTRGCRRRGNSY